MHKDLEYIGKPVKILDCHGKKIFIDFEHLKNARHKFCRIVFKYAGKWYFKKSKFIGLAMINKDNIVKFLD